MNSSFRDGHQFAWDSTSLKAAATCPRYYQYFMIEGITSRGSSVHLWFGLHYASALEHFYKHRALGLSIDESLLLIVREALENTWLDGKPVEYGDSKKSRMNLIRSIIWYVEEFGNEDNSVIKTHHFQDGRPAVEVSFQLDIGEDFILCGHLDRVVSYSSSLFVMDQKTTGGELGPYFFANFKPDIQMSLYTYAGQVLFQSPIGGVIIDGAQIQVGASRYLRGFTYRTQAELEEFIAETKFLIHQMWSYTSLNFFPRNPTACGNYGGCPYRAICATDPKHREQIMQIEYDQKIWSPIERR